MAARLSSSISLARAPYHMRRRRDCPSSSINDLVHARKQPPDSGGVVAALSRYVSVSSMRLPSRAHSTCGCACRRCRIFDSAYHSNVRFMMWVNWSQFSAETSTIGRTAFQSISVCMNLHYVCITVPDALGTFRPPRGHVHRITSLHLKHHLQHTGQTVLRLPSDLLFRHGTAAVWILKRPRRSARFSRLSSELSA